MAKSSKATKVRIFLPFVAGLVIFLLPQHSPAANQVRIGVIPFENITKSEEINWFSQGVAKAISLYGFVYTQEPFCSRISGPKHKTP